MSIEAPVCIIRCLKSYDLKDLDWDRAEDRYTIVREIYNRGEEAAFAWLFERMSWEEVRGLFVSFRGAGMGEAQRRQVRELFDLAPEELPRHPFRDGGSWLRELPPAVVAYHNERRHAS